MKKKFKGNLHTHTTNSDGDAKPEHVAGWYESNGYNFLCLSDHNHLTILNDSDNNKWPLLIAGEEVTSLSGETPVHVNGYGIEKLVSPSESNNVVEALRENILGIIEAGGVASINHPNYKWALSYKELSQVDNYKFIEVFNGHASSNSFGDIKRPSVSKLWDQLLSNGKRVLGLATDDAHHYHEFNSQKANPGRGWIQVFSEKLSKNSILESMSNGDYYASTGIELGEVKLNRKEIIIEVDEFQNSTKNSSISINFIRKNGILAEKADGLSAKYKPVPNDVYIRVEIVSSNGSRLWTQPVWMKN